jgi:energy-coupling factor transport system permease protein
VRPALAYRPGRSPLHVASPGVAIAFLAAFATVAFAFSSPPVLVADGVALALCGVAAGARRAVAASLRLALPLMLVMIAVNGLVYHRGDTVLVRGWQVPVLGNTDVTLESLAAGAAIGLRAVVVILAFAVYSACVNPDAVLRALRPLARRSALTAALVTRLVPLAASDLARVREGAALRGPAAAPVGRSALARRLVAGSLDRSIDVAATLELRGHSLPGRSRPRRDPAGASAALLLSAAAVLCGAALALAAGAGGFETYPRPSIRLDAATLALCAALPALALAPFGARRLRGAVRATRSGPPRTPPAANLERADA